MPRSLIVESFLSEFAEINRYNSETLCNNTSLSWEFYQKIMEQNEPGKDVWIELCRNTNIPVEFFIRYAAYFGPSMWTVLLGNTNIPLEFFERYFDKIQALSQTIIGNPNLSREFLEENADYLRKDLKIFRAVDPLYRYILHKQNFANIRTLYPEVLRNPNLSYEFCLRLVHEKEIPERYLLLNPHTPLDVVRRLTTEDNLFMLLESSFVTEEIADRCWQIIKQDPDNRTGMYPEKFQDPNLQYSGFGVAVLNNPALPIAYFEERFFDLYPLPDPFTFLDILNNPRLSFEFIQRILPRLPPNYRHWVLTNPNITVEFANRLFSEVDFDSFYESIATNSGLPEVFFEDHWANILTILTRDEGNEDEFGEISAEIISESLSKNPALSVDFFERHPECILPDGIISNKFTYQLLLEQGQTERTLIDEAFNTITEGAGSLPSSLPALVTSVMAQEAERLEHRRWYR